MGNGIIDAFYSLGRNLNKVKGNASELETQEGVVSDKSPELTLDMDNEKLVRLTESWKRNWEGSDVYAEWSKNGEENEKYWKGKQYQKTVVAGKREYVDNVIFESLETYLPQTTRRNPDPTVDLARSEPQEKDFLTYCSDLQKTLAEIATELVLRLKLKKGARHSAIYLLAVGKLGWDLDRDIPTIKIIRPQRIILDAEATIDEDGYTGEFVGEHRKLAASTMLSMIESIGGEKDAAQIIKDLAKDKSGNEALATEIGFIEWWTDQYMCWTIDKHVLIKKKNPHWNYAKEAEPILGEDGLPQVDESGAPQLTEATSVENHFATPKKPYILLSVFNLGKQPVDDTSLMGQNLSGQDLVNKRARQIDKNADGMNGGIVVSLEKSGLTMQQAKGVTQAVRDGGVIAIPTGSALDAVNRISANSLPNDIYTQLQDTRIRIRDIFGTRGSSAAGLASEKTVRGKFQNQNLDTDRIGGGFSEYLEQFAGAAYGWFVQLLYVYDDKYSQAPNKPKVKVAVKEGSLLPKDSATLAAQAMELSSQGKISLIDLYKALDYPNPEEMAANVWLEANAPEIAFANDPRVMKAIQAQQEAAAPPQPEPKQPSESISYKDLPPEGKAQMAAKAGIDITPEAVVAKEAAEKIPTIPITNQQ